MCNCQASTGVRQGQGRSVSAAVRKVRRRVEKGTGERLAGHAAVSSATPPYFLPSALRQSRQYHLPLGRFSSVRPTQPKWNHSYGQSASKRGRQQSTSKLIGSLGCGRTAAALASAPRPACTTARCSGGPAASGRAAHPGSRRQSSRQRRCAGSGSTLARWGPPWPALAAAGGAVLKEMALSVV